MSDKNLALSRLGSAPGASASLGNGLTISFSGFFDQLPESLSRLQAVRPPHPSEGSSEKEVPDCILVQHAMDENTFRMLSK